MKESAKEIIIVGIATMSENESKLSEFYEADFLPNLLQVFPEIYSAKRYMKFYPVTKDITATWTIYEIHDGYNAEQVRVEISKRAGREYQRQWWQEQALSLVTEFGKPTAFTAVSNNYAPSDHKTFLALELTAPNIYYAKLIAEVEKLTQSMKRVLESLTQYHIFCGRSDTEAKVLVLAEADNKDELTNAMLLLQQAEILKPELTLQTDIQDLIMNVSCFEPAFSLINKSN